MNSVSFAFQKITFNSVTNFLGPRKFLHSGVLIEVRPSFQLFVDIHQKNIIRNLNLIKNSWMDILRLACLCVLECISLFISSFTLEP